MLGKDHCEEEVAGVMESDLSDGDEVGFSENKRKIVSFFSI